MKIIDEKGRLFGKINIVDFSIILLFLIVIPVFFHIYEVLGKRPARIPDTWIKVETVTFTIPEIAEFFKPGDISCDGFGDPDGKLLKILKKDYAYSDRFKDATLNKHGHRIPVFLELELKCAKSIRDNWWYYRRAPLSLSMEKGFDFGTSKYNIRCFIIKIRD